MFPALCEIEMNAIDRQAQRMADEEIYGNANKTEVYGLRQDYLRDVQQQMLAASTPQRGYIMWLDHNKRPGATSLATQIPAPVPYPTVASMELLKRQKPIEPDKENGTTAERQQYKTDYGLYRKVSHLRTGGAAIAGAASKILSDLKDGKYVQIQNRTPDETDASNLLPKQFPSK